MMKMERPRGSLESEARGGKEAVDHWGLEPACQSGPGAAAYPVLLPPGSRGARGAGCLPATPPATRLRQWSIRSSSGVLKSVPLHGPGTTEARPPGAIAAPVLIWGSGGIVAASGETGPGFSEQIRFLRALLKDQLCPVRINGRR